jgi:hypothetical protein
MYGIPSAVIIVNKDLTNNIIYNLSKQLYITDVIDGYTFDGYVEQSDGYYNSEIKAANKRVMVIRDLREHQNRDQADLVMFVSHGMVSVEQNKFGPPRKTFRIAELYWGKLAIYNIQT